MNTELFGRIIAWLEGGTPHVKFSMAEGLVVEYCEGDNVCATACCIAGAAVQFGAPNRVRELAFKDDVTSDIAIDELAWPDVRDEACELLDIPFEDASSLFEPGRYYRNEVGLCTLDITDPLGAARVLRHYVATGEVDWTKYFDD